MLKLLQFIGFAFICWAVFFLLTLGVSTILGLDLDLLPVAILSFVAALVVTIVSEMRNGTPS